MRFWDIIIGSIILIYAVICRILSPSNLNFTIPFILLGMCLILYHFVKVKFQEYNFYKRIKSYIKVVAAIVLVCFIVLEAAIIFYPKHNKDEADYILVLGAGLSNGFNVSLTLKGRLDKALEDYDLSNKNSKIVVSGGQGSDERIAEAEAMKNYLLHKGVDESNIIMEDKSRNTFENFKFSKSKIEEDSNKDMKDINVKVVTTDFHALRSAMLAKRNGFENLTVDSSKTVNYLIPELYGREAAALVKSYILDR